MGTNENKSRAVDYLNNEWASLLVQANNKIALLSDEVDRLNDVVEKQNNLIKELEGAE